MIARSLICNLIFIFLVLCLGYNHHNGIEPDWRNACWGDNYERLSLLKNEYDPNHTFNCWHCVGYEGEEMESDDTVDPNAAMKPIFLGKIIGCILGVFTLLML